MSPRTFDRKRYYRERQDLRAAERLDVLEAPPPPKGCNARDESGRRCGQRVVSKRPGPLSMRRLCAEHEAVYAVHDRILTRILAAPARRVT